MKVSSLLALVPFLFGYERCPAAENRVGLTVELVSEVTHIQPGVPFYLGVMIRHEPGFHTYWKQPGIVGVPTHIEWKLPRGWKGGELEFPEPESVLMHTIKAQGFARDVLLQVQMIPPGKLKSGTTVTLNGKAIWMCCARSCHPGFKDLTITLPVLDEEPALDAKWKTQFQLERTRQPRPSAAWSSSAWMVSPNEIEVILLPQTAQARNLTAKNVAQIVFFTGDGWIDSDRPHQIEWITGGGLKMRLPLSRALSNKRPPKSIEGLVQLPGGWYRDGSLKTLLIQPTLAKSPPAP